MKIIAKDMTGAVYRWMEGTICGTFSGGFSVVLPIGTEIHHRGEVVFGNKHIIMNFWERMPYNILDFYHSSKDASPFALYTNVCSAPTVTDNDVTYTDYYLDVILKEDASIEVRDIDEFEEYLANYPYDQSWKAHCWDVCTQLEPILHERWTTAFSKGGV